VLIFEVLIKTEQFLPLYHRQRGAEGIELSNLNILSIFIVIITVRKRNTIILVDMSSI